MELQQINDPHWWSGKITFHVKSIIQVTKGMDKWTEYGTTAAGGRS